MQLDGLDLDVVEKIAWVVLACAAAEVCTEVAQTLREQRRRDRDRPALPSGGIDIRPLIAAQLALTPPPAPAVQLLALAGLGSGQT